MRISNPIFSTEDFEITHIGLFVSEEFISSFLEEFVKIYPIDDVARSINNFRPELSWCLVFIEHRPSHLNECSVLALHDAILLRSVWSRKLMSDAKCIKVSVEAGVLEFCAIVTSDMLDLDTVVRHGLIG